MGGCSFRNTEGKLIIIEKHIEPGLYPSIVDLVVAINDKVRKRIGAQKHDYKGICVISR